MMSNGVRRLGCVGLLLCCVWAVGCQSEQVMRERQDLWEENQALRDELAREKSAKQAAEAERARLASENENLRNQPPAAMGVAPVADANTAFSGIEGVETISSPGKITVRVPGDVLFAPGRADLRPEAKKTLDKIADVINRDYPSNTISIEGYTDTDPIRKSRWTDNLDLSLQRAAAVHRELQKQGIDPKRMEAAGLGEWHPRSTKAKSRRVEIVVKLYE